MTNVFPLILWNCMITFSGCSTVRVSQAYRPETDFSDLKTYRWQPIEEDIRGDAPMDDPLRDEHVRNDVERNLYSLGFRRETAAKPDVSIDCKYSV